MPPPPARPDSSLRMGRELPPLEPFPAREWDLTQWKPLIKSEILPIALSELGFGFPQRWRLNLPPWPARRLAVPEVRGRGDTSVQNGGYFGLALSAACG